MSALRKACSRLSAGVAVATALIAVCAVAVQAQTAATLSQVRKIYVEPFSGKLGAGEIRNEMIERLKHHSELTVVGSASQADAVLKGSGKIWVSGYIGNNPRAQGSSRSPIYNGYLSLTLEGGNAQPLWSSHGDAGRFCSRRQLPPTSLNMGQNSCSRPWLHDRESRGAVAGCIGFECSLLATEPVGSWGNLSCAALSGMDPILPSASPGNAA